MKSCHVVPSLEVRHGGPSKSVLSLAAALARGGDEVELLSTDPGAGWHRSDGRLEIRAFHRDWPGSVCASSGMRSYLRSARADIVHHHSIWLRTLHYAHQAARRTGAALVVSPRGMMSPWAWDHHSRRKAIARALIHPGAFEAVDGWHATSSDEADSLRALGFRQPVCVAPNGVAAPSREESAAAAAHWRRLVPECAQRPVALFYSRFHQKKRLIELIDLWLEQGPGDWLLLVAGIPDDYSPRMIEDYVLRSGQVGRVRAVDGLGHPPPYGIASLFLLPSHSENFGLSIAEALAHGVPALVTDTTPWSGLNQAGAGWCVPWPKFGAALRSATTEGLDSLRRRGSIGSEWVLREYSWEKAARMLAEFYAGLRSGAVARSP
ncbi:MAG TPA: glycosyltransferase [Opitutaceae bacterium]|nr:glycosyltransferase [Opitutaceae bacterium]